MTKEDQQTTEGTTESQSCKITTEEEDMGQPRRQLKGKFKTFQRDKEP
jgi:hypothetical protein